MSDKTCPCCGGLKHRIGKGVSERLDVTPAQFKVLVLHRPKYACRACEGEVSQASSVKYLASIVCLSELVDLWVRDRSVGPVKVSGLRAVSSDPLRRDFPNRDLTIEAKFRQDIEGYR